MAQDKKITALPKAANLDLAPVPEKPEPRLDAPAQAPAPEAEAAAPPPQFPEPSRPEFIPGTDLKAGTPPPIPNLEAGMRLEAGTPPKGAPSDPQAVRRSARRRAAGPVRTKLAANDDAPSIGGLIYALDQKPTLEPFRYAAMASGVWALLGLVYAWFHISAELATGATVAATLSQPQTFFTLAAIVVPIAVLYFLALLAWRSEELRLRSSTMTEVAVRLAEPDRMAEQSVASLGQAVRRQVSFMNDAVSRALGRASELEALVHNEVSALERSYEDNERKIRSLIEELAGERDALLNTSRNVTDTLKSLGTDIPGLIDKLASQQVKLSHIIQGAGENLTGLETAVSQSAMRLENTLGTRTEQLQYVLENYTDAIGQAIGSRTEGMQVVLESYTSALADALSSRTEQFKSVFEEYGQALDTTMANRAQSLDLALVERTKALDQAFSDRLRLFDESIMRSTMAIDRAVTDKSTALTTALDAHARVFNETISRQSLEIDETLMHGINAVRRSSENITRQSLKAIEGLASQSEMLRNVSENLLGQINSVTGRFENQGQAIMKAANALESVNYKIDNTLQSRHADLSNTLDRLSGKAEEFGRVVEGYSTTIEGSLTDVESRARSFAEQLKLGTETTKRAALEDLERMRRDADSEGQRALDELRRRFASVSTAVNEQLDTLSSRVDQTSDEVRQRAQRAAEEIAAEQARLREQIERLPMASRETTESMRRALQDQMKALEQLSNLTSRTMQQRDISLPALPPAGVAGGSYPYEPRGEANPRRPQQAASASEPSTGRGYGAPFSEPQRHYSQPSLPRPSGPPMMQDGRESWSLGDLLARASREEEQGGVPAQGELPQAPAYQLNIEVIARALDTVTAQALWSRIRAGQRGVMVRSIYSQDGRTVFDEVSRRYRGDADLRRTVDRYLTDFDRMRAETDQRDPTGRMSEAQIVSDSGRVFLFLAHAAGRL